MRRHGIPNSRREDLSTTEKRAALTTITTEITQHQNDIRALTILQRELEDSLNLAVYPVLTLPNEITTQIFVGCLPTHGCVRPSPQTAPLLLVQVCRHWRNVALFTRELWSSIEFSAPGKKGRAPLIETWFSRARAHPLSLKLNSLPADILPLIPSVTAQIRCLELSLHDRHLPHLPVFPLLHILRTSLDGGALRPLITQAPLLRELRVYTLDFTAVITLRRLRSLDIGAGISIKTFIGLLDNLSRLSHLRCTVKESKDGNPLPQTFEQLLSLDLHRSQEDVLEWVTLPHLLRLRICDQVPSIDVLTSFLTRSACSLDDLRIFLDDSADAGADITRLLQACSSVVTLGVKIDEYMEPFLSSLVSTPSLLPRLENLTISASADQIDFEDVVQVLESRRHSSNPVELKTFPLKKTVLELGHCSACTFPGDVVTGMQRLIEGGLSLDIVYEDLSYIESWPNETPIVDDLCE